MRLFLAAGLLLASSQAAAVLLGSQSAPMACGPAARGATIERMKVGVRQANAGVLQDFRALNQDPGGREKPAATDAAIAEADRAAQELGSLIDIMQAGDATGNALESASLFAAIREQTVYGGDKVAANERLSLLLYLARQEAEKAYRTIRPAAAKITRPGVAADVAKLLAEIETVVKVLGNCLPPALGTPRK